MQRIAIRLEDDQLDTLRKLAAADRRSVSSLVRHAVTTFLAEKREDGAVWGSQLDRLMARIQEQVPRDVTPDEIEADITAARVEWKQARRVAREG
jgi:Arc/MetJ-type ribon-helix-helix transcriptional regulator